jgi:hypothetical protein
MPARKRTGTQRDHDRATIARMYLKGATQAEIGATLGVSQQQISHDLAQIRAAWAASAVADLDQAKTEQLARLDLLERTYWASFHRSDAPGDPRYLAGVERTIEQRCRILGLYAPKQIDLGLAALADRAAAETGLRPEAVVAEAERWLREGTP